MDAEGRKKNALTYVLITKSYLARRNTAMAVATLQSMRSAGFQPDLKLCDAVRDVQAAFYELSCKGFLYLCVYVCVSVG